MSTNDVLAEAQVLGMVLVSETEAGDRFLTFGADAWTSSQHQVIAAAIADHLRRGNPVTVPGVQREASRRMGTDEAARRLSLYVFELHETAAPLTSLTYWTDRLHRVTRAKRAMQEAVRFRQRVESSLEIDDEAEYDQAVKDMAVAVEDAATTTAGAATPPMSLAGLLELDVTYDWLVPGLLERMDRVIITGFEGLGKSELICQFACACAGGVHPFNGDVLPATSPEMRVLVVDAENSEAQLQRRYRRVQAMVTAIRRREGMDGDGWHHRIHFVNRPDGIALSQPRELARIEQAIVATAPHLVVAGPIYKLADQDTRDEQVAKELTVTLDRLRQRYQFALLLEAHSGHGNNLGPRSVRPTGSSVFLRWPEFGYGLRPHEDSPPDADHPDTVRVVPWRGPREERGWPKALARGSTLPWEPTTGVKR